MPLEILKQEVTCAVCNDIFKHPVTLTCGHSFCQVCITTTFDNQPDWEHFCPECMKQFKRLPELKKNPRLSNIAKHFLSMDPKGKKPENICSFCVFFNVCAVKFCLHCEAFLCDLHQQAHKKSPEHVLVDPTTPLEDRKCPVHKKLLEYFCTVDGTCICAHCLTEDHNGHRAGPISEVWQQKTKNLKPILENLFSKREETEEMLQCLQDYKRELNEIADNVTKKVTTIMRDIRRQMDDIEKTVLAEVSKKKEQIKLSVSNSIHQLKQEKCELQKNITQLEGLRRFTDPLSALQSPEILFSVLEDDFNLDKYTDRITIDYHGDLDEAVILQTLHSGLSDIMANYGKNINGKDVQKVSSSVTNDNANKGNRYSSNEYQSKEKTHQFQPMQYLLHSATKTQIKGETAKPQRVARISSNKISTPEMLVHEITESNSLSISAKPQRVAPISSNKITTPEMVLDENSDSHSLSISNKSQKVTRISRNKISIPEMLLDENTASNFLLISDDLKTVSRSDVYLNRPETWERFQVPQVLSTKGISSGKHILEMEISKTEGRNGDSLFVGMCYPTIDKRGQSLNEDSNIVWGLWVNDMMFSVIQKDEVKSLCEASSGIIQLELDYVAGRLSFHELNNSIRHLHTFTAKFTEPLHLIVSLQGSCWLKILKQYSP